jgi:hypothetical protein
MDNGKAANVAAHNRVSHVTIHLPILWISLLDQGLHILSIPQVILCPHAFSNLHPHLLGRLEKVWHGLTVAEETVHLMHVMHATLSPPRLAESLWR